jgi:hypothetical protein
MQNKEGLTIKKDNQFCRKVVAHYLLKTNLATKDNLQSEVDKWIDYHCSEEFNKAILNDVFMLCHYQAGLKKMVSDYLEESENPNNE